MTYPLTHDLRPWWTFPITVVDCETTGVDVREHRVIEVGAVRFEQGIPVRFFSSLIASVDEVSEEITGITGIRASDLVGAPRFNHVVPRLYALAHGSIVAAFNAEFDQSFFLSEMSRTQFQLGGPLFDPSAAWLDPLVWSRQVDRYVKGGHKLSTVCERYNIALDGAHRADADAAAAGRVLFAMRKRIGDMTVDETLRLQRIFAEQQEQRFQEWKMKKEASGGSQG